MKHSIYHIISCLVLGLAFAACSNEEIDYPGTIAGEGDLSVQVIPAQMGIYKVGTRGTDPKDYAEQEIKSLHLFLFNSKGDYLKATQNDAFQGYEYITSAQTVRLQSAMFAADAGAENATVYAFANFPEDYFGTVGTDGIPENVPNKAALKELSYTLPTFTATLPEGGLPMVGVETGKNLTSGASERVIAVKMRSLMARVDLNFTMNPNEICADNLHPSFKATAITVHNFPKSGKLVPAITDKNIEAKNLVTIGELQESYDVTESDLLNVEIRKGETATATFYMFEHARQPKDFDYPEGMTDPDKQQRFKPKRATEGAAYITVKGDYVNHNAYLYHVAYDLYLGGNHTDNFVIASNRQYKNNISIKGITANGVDSEGGEALLDVRVTIDKSTNPYFISMLRERRHDAHFCVTPMDIYLKEGARMKVEILDAEEDNWLRMESLHDSPTGNGLYAATNPGDGKRDYFTTDLVTNTLKNSTTYTASQREERIYFYLDENTNPDNDPNNVDAQGNIKDREATVRLYYFAPGNNSETPTETRDITIEQRGLLKVHFNKFSAGGTHPKGHKKYDFYIEYYEEYLDFYDPKDRFTAVYEGLEWGMDGVKTDLGGVVDWADFLDYGWRNTKQMMEKYREWWKKNKPGVEWKEMTLKDKPRSAAEYCYNKNKRNGDGSVPETRWYFPTISELEYAIDKYYGTFRVFQAKWYWSSNPAPDNKAYGERTDNARATMSVYKNGEFVHETSAEGELGNLPRTDVYRIRAAYIKEVPDGAPDVK